MASNDPDELKPLSEGKLFPRNLTAKAGRVVAGNPVQSRPESGVDNTHPGLELDQRNLDRVFFPGLTVDFQFGIGARVVGLSASWEQHVSGQLGRPLTDEEKAGLFVWGVFGRFGNKPQQPMLLSLFPLDGYDVLRKVHDLEAGEVAVVIGTRPAVDGPVPDVHRLVEKRGLPSQPCDVLQAEGPLAFVLRGSRSDYLDPHGVIDPDVLPPGSLTQSLCSPWQWDFADCGCYYWAASRPDIVTGADGSPDLNYQRDRKPAVDKPEEKREKIHTWDGWISPQMSQVQMITRWHELPLVIGDRERADGDVVYPPPPAPAPSPSGPVAHKPPPKKPDPVTFASIVARLTQLATVEHALCVQYLYAHYSVRVPDPRDTTDTATILRAAGQGMRELALAEMRHMRQVNEALSLLDAPPSLKRGDALELRSLTDAAIDVFIEVERPGGAAANANSSYVKLRDDVDALEFPQGGERKKALLIGILDRLIQDGDDHARELEGMKESLRAIPEALRLQVRGPAQAADAAFEEQQATADRHYAQLLDALGSAYALDSTVREQQVLRSRGLMVQLDVIGQALAARGVGLRFSEPAR